MAKAKTTAANGVGSRAAGARGAKARSPIAAFNALPDAEKQRIAAQFDREFVPTEPLTPGQRKLWRKVQRGRGRPKVGQGAQVVSVSIERGLLKQADALARRRNITRTELVSAALRAELAKAG